MRTLVASRSLPGVTRVVLACPFVIGPFRLPAGEHLRADTLNEGENIRDVVSKYNFFNGH